LTSLDGTLRHGAQVAVVGDEVVNYGPLGLDQGVVDAPGRAFVERRSAPGDLSPVLGQVAAGETVTVACSVRGNGHVGRSALSTTLWDRLADGSYVSDAFLATGTSGPVRGYCP
jgi:LasA protease